MMALRPARCAALWNRGAPHAISVEEGQCGIPERRCALDQRFRSDGLEEN